MTERYTRAEEIRRTLGENRNDYAEHLQQQMRSFIENEISKIRADLVRTLPGLIRRECRKVLAAALSPAKKAKGKR